MGPVRLGGQPVSIGPSCGAQTLVTLNIKRKVFSQILSFSRFIGSIDFCHFMPLSVNLALAGSQKGNTEPVGFIFSHTCQLN